MAVTFAYNFLFFGLFHYIFMGLIMMMYQAWRFNVLGATQNTQMDLLNIVEKKVWEKSSYTSWIPCDAILAAVLLRPDIVIKSQKCHATVELHGAHTRGQVVIDHLKVKDPNVHFIEEFDTSILKKMLLWAAGHADLDYDKSK
jgi:inosine-uridine nucleoside N-ribohydrolase